MNSLFSFYQTVDFLHINIVFTEQKIRGRSRGGRGGRTPPLSEFQPLVMGLFATVHAPLQSPTPRSVFTRVIY